MSRARTILLVDDDPFFRKVLCAHLLRSGFEVVSAADGPDALQLARQFKGVIDLLITDVMMPGMSGPELASALQLCRADLSVMLISASADFQPAAGKGWEFLRKPFAPAVLLAKVRAMFPDESPAPAAAGELLKHRMREARAEYLRYSEEYDLLLALTGDPAAADAERKLALRKAAEVRKSTLHAYAEAVRAFGDFLRIRQMTDTGSAKAIT